MNFPAFNQKDVLILACSVCPFHTLFASKLLDHYKTEHSTRACPFTLYQCQYCQLVATASSVLFEHSVLQHANKEPAIKCLYNEIGEPEKLSTDIQHKCLLCPFQSIEAKNMCLHYFAFHGVRNVSMPPIYRSPKAIRNYVRHDETFVDLSNDDDGHTEAHRITSPENAGGTSAEASDVRGPDKVLPYHCHHCGNAYSKRKYFVEHVSSCSKTLQLACPCGRVCKWRSNFYAHRKSCPIYNQLIPGGASSISNRRSRRPRPTSMAFSSSGQLIGVATGSPIHQSLMKNNPGPSGEEVDTFTELSSTTTAGYTPSDATYSNANNFGSSFATGAATNLLSNLDSCLKPEELLGLPPATIVSGLPQAIENLSSFLSSHSNGNPNYFTPSSTILTGPVSSALTIAGNIPQPSDHVPVVNDILFPGMLPEPTSSVAST